LREIFLRICRNLGVPEEWSRQWDDEPDPADAARDNAAAPRAAAGPTDDLRPRAADPDAAEAPPEGRQKASPPAGIPARTRSVAGSSLPGETPPSRAATGSDPP
jgi:hypothetical protein